MVGEGAFFYSFTGFWDPIPHSGLPFPAIILGERCLVLLQHDMPYSVDIHGRHDIFWIEIQDPRCTRMTERRGGRGNCSYDGK